MEAIAKARLFVAGLDRRLGDRLRAVVLFGSQARGEARPDSDVDLLILLRDAPPYFERCFLAGDVAREVDADFSSRLSPLLYDEREARDTRPIFYDIAVDGIVLLDRAGAWAQIRERVLARIRELGSQRVTDSAGNRFWILAPSAPFGTPVEL
ncbi:MAG: nucleotidyltransferase domain-containing protein [Myxococcota bacterium]